LVENSSNSSLAKAMKSVLMDDLKDQYNDVMGSINKACFLDPRFKALPFMTNSDKNCIATSVEEAQEFTNDNNTSFDSTSTINLTYDNGPPPPKKVMKGLMSLLDDVVNSKYQVDKDAPISESDRMKAEVEREMKVVTPCVVEKKSEALFTVSSVSQKISLCPSQFCSIRTCI